MFTEKDAWLGVNVHMGSSMKGSATLTRTNIIKHWFNSFKKKSNKSGMKMKMKWKLRNPKNPTNSISQAMDIRTQ